MSELTEKTIKELLGLEFFIPSYQRGYRWTERQIEDLLNDIHSFQVKCIWEEDKKNEEKVEKQEEETWYSLQPIIVKKINKNYYEVIDGQQRLTSIFLIMHYAKQEWNTEKYIQDIFSIEYETRKNSSKFIRELNIKEENKVNDSNVDFYHISKAFKKIHEWVVDKNENFNHNDFLCKFLNNTKVIWYEVPKEKNSIEIFTRVNMGKIPLTNAELIKALFLNSSNFSNYDADGVRLRQLEIASEWDKIEYTLQNDEFWYFISNLKSKSPTRIEFLFDIMFSQAKGEKENNNISFDKKYGKDEYAIFRFFSEKFKNNNKEEIDKNWQEIKRMFQTIDEWFSDRNLYHKIGYLITTGRKIGDLLTKARGITKGEFKSELEGNISDTVECDNLYELEYGKNSALIRKILLLHNIRTMLNNTNETNRFPFNRYKVEKWDIEHIHAIASKVKVENENLSEWIENNYTKSVKDSNHSSDEIEDLIKNIKVKTKVPTDEETKKVIEYILGEEDNSIRNLCLLDRGTNRSYKNDAFKSKRKKIIENELNGTFIPICTRNIFLKYYTENASDLEVWNDNDRKSYFNNLEKLVFNKRS